MCYMITSLESYRYPSELKAGISLYSKKSLVARTSVPKQRQGVRAKMEQRGYKNGQELSCIRHAYMTNPLLGHKASDTKHFQSPMLDFSQLYLLLFHFIFRVEI